MYDTYLEILIHKEYFGYHFDHADLFHEPHEAQEGHKSEPSGFIQKTMNLD